MEYIKPTCECGNELALAEIVATIKRLDINANGRIENYDAESAPFYRSIELVCDKENCNKKFKFVTDSDGRIWKDEDFVKAMSESLKKDGETDGE